MVLINTGNRSTLPRRSHRHSRNDKLYARWALLACAGVTVASLLYSIVWITRAHRGHRIRRSDQAEQFNRNHHHRVDENYPELGLEDTAHGENEDLLDAIASDILMTLECHSLLGNQEPVYGSFGYIYGGLTMWDLTDNERTTRRRLDVDDSVKFDANEGLNRPEADRMDDDNDGMAFGGNGEGSFGARITAAHLFCMAAFPAKGVPEDMDETVWWHDKVQCGVRTSAETQRSLLDLWSTAKAEIGDVIAFRKLLQVATEQSVDLFGKRLNIWAAPNDLGTEYFVNNAFKAVHEQQILKYPNQDEKNGIANEYDYLTELHANLGEGKLFVDVGSGLGYTAMAIAILYPGTQIISIEAAFTNWLLQELNWRCNDFEGMEENGPPNVVLAGIGPSTATSQAARFVWRPTATTNTRGWALNAEVSQEGGTEGARFDMELNVKLRPWHMVQAEAEMVGRQINVLNVDCEGCEYNFIPALSETDFASISTIVGQLHWSYIPALQLPSSKRAEATHRRLCQHEDFARSAIECCAFPDLQVKSRASGEILILDSGRGAFPEVPATVKFLAGNLCDTFGAWAETHNLFNVESDWGWFQGGTARKVR